jgi:Spy/CpxP family protein refolding chaperone
VAARAFASLLGAAALVAAATLAQPALAMPGGPGGPHGEMHGGMDGGMGVAFAHPAMTGRLLDSVNATPEQRTQIKALAEAAQRDLQAERSASGQLREQAAALFAQPTVDARAAEALRQQMLARHDSASKRMTQLMLDVSRVLTPQQRQKLAERMAQRRDLMERHQRERRQLERPQG